VAWILLNHQSPCHELRGPPLADGVRRETWLGHIDCEFDGKMHPCDIVLIVVAQSQDPPLILGMSFLKLFKGDLTLHFSTKTFALDVRR